MRGSTKTRHIDGTGFTATLEALLGIVLIVLAVFQLVSDQESLPGFAATILLIVVLLAGVALTYLGVERRKDIRHKSDGAHSQDHKRDELS